MDAKYQIKLKTAKEFENQGKSLHAIQIYKSLIIEYPDIPESYIYLADVFQSIGKTKNAEDVIRRVYEMQPDNYETALYYSQFLMQNENWVKAIKLLTELNSPEPFAEYLFGYCYYRIGEYHSAKEYLLHFVKSDEEPDLILEAYFMLAKLEFELKHYEDALNHAKKAELIFNNDWELYLVYAKIYYKFKMFIHSRDSINKGIKINSGISVLYKWAGKIEMKLDNFSEAKEQFKKYINLKDRINSEDYNYLADSYLKCNELNNALFYYQSAFILDAHNKRAIIGKEKILKLIEDNAVSDG